MSDIFFLNMETAEIMERLSTTLLIKIRKTMLNVKYTTKLSLRLHPLPQDKNKAKKNYHTYPPPSPPPKP